jgi:hypothetical protein
MRVSCCEVRRATGSVAGRSRTTNAKDRVWSGRRRYRVNTAPDAFGTIGAMQTGTEGFAMAIPSCEGTFARTPQASNRGPGCRAQRLPVD